MKTILAPIDFSIASEKALEYIKKVFADYQLVILYVTQPGEASNEISRRIEKFDNQFLKNTSLNYEFVITEGQLLNEIQTLAQRVQPDYIILGTHGAALAKALVKNTSCPVFIVPEGNNTLQIRKIAYANDFNDIKNSLTLMPLTQLSRTFGAKVYIIHVNRGEDALTDHAEASLEYYLEKVDHEYVHIPGKNIEETLNAYLAEKNIDLLTVLLRDHGSNELKSNGKLVEEIVSHARMPVLNLV